MKKFVAVLGMTSILALGACESLQNRGNKERIGSASGAVLGGIAGAQIGGGDGRLIATGVGTLLGALAGSEIGRSLDRADMLYAERSQQQAYDAPLGETISWVNPESGNSGSYTPVRDGYTETGRYCREFRQTIYIDGQAETGFGRACKAPGEAEWEIVS